MINKVIKSEKEAAKVAKALAKDLRDCLAIFESYEASVVGWNNQYEVMVISPKGISNILTGACIKEMMAVVQMYELQYTRISYHMEVEQQGEKYLPAFTVCIGYEEENQEV